MHIILGHENVEKAQEKYTVLELDTLLIDGSADPVTAYCLVERIPIAQIHTIDQFRDLHTNLMSNYRKRNWKYCEDALEHLQGKWCGELDSFYTELYHRIQKHKTETLGPDWNGVLIKTS